MAASSVIDVSAALAAGPATAAQWLVVLPAASCLLLSAVLVMLWRQPRLQQLLAVAGLAFLVLVDLLLLRQVLATGPVTMVMGRWLPPFGIAFTADLTGVLMALAAALVAFVVCLSAAGERETSGRGDGFYPMLLMLMAGVSGAFLTGDIFNLYVWFEVLLIASFGLIALGPERAQIDGALKYAVLNLVATTLFLIAVGILYAVFGTLNMADIVMKAPDLRETAPLVTLTALFLLAFGMKAAAFPVNFWLPAAYHTPRPAVAALFAGLLTKVGIYALLRVTVMLFPPEREQLEPLIATVAVATMLTGGLGALAQNDIRRMLGFVVIAGIGTVLAGLSLGGPGGIGGALFYALHSMVLMTALYLAIGEAGRIGGSFSLAALGGLYGRHAGFAGLCLCLFFAASGLPPFSGFWPKAMLVKAALDVGAWWLAGAMLLSGFLLTIAFGRVFLMAFWRPAKETAPPVLALRWQAIGPLLLLAALVVGFGAFPELLLRTVQDAEITLDNPQAYLGSVFPQGAAP
ncbi:Na+/H+ antiporter subunit D [Metarhizobium album]|uniref:Na+/H+ antiporter subunit D n=1 Tax=Metarhizobium album TaxID=2182425 RepID=A0A2U2DY74_9HYPH|nr:Na+/H+ antiporter subunit D [Rhizobium album]PWE58152.1 Na+/H+ antiporter subunit D [Rhizobium album]